jgi:hypothetical protein
VSILETRVESLEKLYQGSSTAYENSEAAEELERRREKMKANLGRAEEKAAAEEAQGDTRRRHALDELYRSMKRRQKGTD